MARRGEGCGGLRPRYRARGIPNANRLAAHPSRWRAPRRLAALLSEEQRSSYESEGFLVLEDFATAEEVAELRGRGNDLVSTFDPETISIFSTKKQEKTMNGEVRARCVAEIEELAWAREHNPRRGWKLFSGETSAVARHHSDSRLSHCTWLALRTVLGTTKTSAVNIASECLLRHRKTSVARLPRQLRKALLSLDKSR